MPTNVSEEAAPTISALHICDEAPAQAIDASSLAAAATASATAAAAAAARDAPMVVLEGAETVVVLSAAPAASASPAAEGESLLLALPAELGAKVLASLPLASLVRSRAACRTLSDWTANVVQAMSSVEAEALRWMPALPNLPALPALCWLYQATPNFLPTRVSLPRVGCNGCVALLRANADRAAALRELDLEGATAVTDAALQAIGFAAPPLRRLALRHISNISDDGVDKLGYAVLGGLEELSLGGCTKLTNGTMYTLVKHCDSLTTLRLDGCRGIDDFGISVLGDQFSPWHRCMPLAQLTAIDVSKLPEVRDTGICEMVHNRSTLTDLNVALCAKVGDASLRALAANCAELRALNLTATAVTNEGLAALAQGCPKLARVNLTRCAEVGDDGVIMLALRCTELASLFVARCAAVTDASLGALGSFSRELAELHIAGCEAITDAGVVAVAAGCAKLGAFLLDTCSGITDAGICEVAKRCTLLHTLQAIGCSGIGDESLLALARHSRSLARLDVRGCSRITEVGLEACDRDLKGCRIFAQRSHV